MPPIYTAFYTIGTRYEVEADRLRRSLDRFGLKHDIRGVADRGSWVLNTQLTAQHIHDMLHAYPTRTVVQLDADAYVHRYPELLDELAEDDIDIAVHYRLGRELLNGTVLFNPTPMARAVAAEYLRLIASDPRCRDEQTKLAAAIVNLSPALHVHRLPPEYCWIHDVMAADIGDRKPVIEHLQASREATNSTLLPNRRKRIAELGE